MAKTAVIVGGVLALAVVGGAALMMSDDKKEEAATPAASTSQTTASDQKSSSLKNITETAVDTPALSTLVTAVTAADLATTLGDESKQFTVFAPTNDAFEALPEGTLTSLLKPENKSQLSNVLTYHVVASKALSSDLKDGQKIKTVQGKELTVKISNGMVYINDALVTQADVATSNGVVHVINKVLLP